MNSTTLDDKSSNNVLTLAAEIISSYVSNNRVGPTELPDLIQSVYSSLIALDGENGPQAKPQNPAVSIKRSITDEHIICLEDGKKLKMLKRYLRTRFGLSPDEYRRKWGLPADYPMVAPAYAKRRSEFAKQIGLGRGVGRRKK
ncbi:MAG: transcriptional regulator [Robiginitomaculum sp.]|nr:MAG: transcriptional regulator [Robiginitomaculum sp.]